MMDLKTDSVFPMIQGTILPSPNIQVINDFCDNIKGPAYLKGTIRRALIGIETENRQVYGVGDRWFENIKTNLQSIIEKHAEVKLTKKMLKTHLITDFQELANPGIKKCREANEMLRSILETSGEDMKNQISGRMASVNYVFGELSRAIKIAQW
jgi:hypothetical protein